MRNLPFLIFMIGFVAFPAQVLAYDLWNQGYVESEPELLECGSACIGSPEIQSYLYTDYQIQQRGIFIEQDGADILDSRIPWERSRKKWLRKFGRSLYKRKGIYTSSAFRIGILIQDRDKSVGSAVWREIRKPLLYTLRDKITDSLKKRKGNLNAWVVEQGLDIGASAAGLDSNGEVVGVLDSDEITDKVNYKTSFSPKIDPWKGRYGFRLKYKLFRGLRDPYVFQVSYYFCNANWGVGDRICAYLHQTQVAVGYRFRANKSDFSFHLSVYHEAQSLDPEAYIVDNEPYEFKPWGFRAQIRVAI